MTSKRERDGEGARIAALLERLPAEARPAADEAIRDAGDAGELVERLETLVATREDADLDEVVAGADSVADLAEARDPLADPPDATARTANRADPGAETVNQPDPQVGPASRSDPPAGTESDGGEGDRDVTGGSGPLARLRSAVGSVLDRIRGRGGDPATGDTRGDAGETPQRTDDEGRSPVRRIRDRTGAGLDRVRYTVSNASPGEAALWGLGAGLAVANPAIAAGYSTYALLGGAVAGGVGLGAYKSSHDGTPLDDVDPLALGREINRATASNRSLEDVDPERVGAVLGASTDALERVTPEAYAQWAVRADPEAVLRGAQYGAAHAEEMDGRRGGMALGGGMGLLYGYAAADRDLSPADLEDVVGAGGSADSSPATGTDALPETDAGSRD